MALSDQRRKARNRLWTVAAGYGSIRAVITPHPSRQSPFHTRRGLTLVEVMVAMIILAFAGLGVVQATYQMRVTAEDSIHQSTACIMAQGYLEQLCRLPYNTVLDTKNPYTLSNPAGIQNIADNPYTTNDQTSPIFLTNSNGLPVTNRTGTNLYNTGSSTPVDQNTSTETVFLDHDSAGNPSYPMTISFTPVLTDLQTITGGTSAPNNTGSPVAPNIPNIVTGGTAQGVEIIIYFSATYNIGPIPHTFTSSVRTVYGNVPTY